jgi:phosphoribosylamine--glycine ligase
VSALSDPQRKNILLVGSGGREHALASRLLKSKKAGKLFIAPGNGGTYDYNVPIKSDEIDKLAEFSRTRHCLTIVGPEVPLAAGIVDKFTSENLEIFGPTREQARLETSKAYAKEFMQRLGIPTAEFKVFIELHAALDYVSRLSGKVVVKADGLAAGKGVFVCSTEKEAEKALRFILEKKGFGSSGDRVVIEEKLHGREISLIGICDGKSCIPLETAVDHKRALDGDKGPNTGGMGAFSPAENFSSTEIVNIVHSILEPTVRAAGFRGFLYLGLMLDEENRPNVLEYNVRLGDPETQVILPRLESDLFDYLSPIAEGKELPIKDLQWSPQSACTVVMASEGYPATPRVGDEIRGLEKARAVPGAITFHSGTAKRDKSFFTAGGRVLSVTGLGATKTDAAKKAYEAVNLINWDGEHHRHDIGALRS